MCRKLVSLVHVFFKTKFYTPILKVDRSAAYGARWVAKSLVAAGICRRCLVQVIDVVSCLIISFFRDELGEGGI